MHPSCIYKFGEVDVLIVLIFSSHVMTIRVNLKRFSSQASERKTSQRRFFPHLGTLKQRVSACRDVTMSCKLSGPSLGSKQCSESPCEGMAIQSAMACTVIVEDTAVTISVKESICRGF